MPQVCLVCSHDQRREIDKALAAGKAKRGIARAFGLSEDSVERHARSGHLLRMVASQERVRTMDVAAALVETYEQACSELEAAEKSGDRATWAKVKLQALDMASKNGVDLPTENGRVTVTLRMAGAEPDSETG